MKRLIAVVVAVALLSFLFAFVPSVVYSHPSWNSYEDSDRTIDCDNFTAGNQTVYMQGVLPEASHDYKVAYYENKTGASDEAHLLAIDIPKSNSNKILESSLHFPAYKNFPSGWNDPGIWHSVVYDATDSPPATYNATDPDIVEDDIFNVTAGAIPEFPTIFAGIGVAGLCFGTYYWMRKKRLKFKMKNSNLGIDFG